MADIKEEYIFYATLNDKDKKNYIETFVCFQVIFQHFKKHTLTSDSYYGLIVALFLIPIFKKLLKCIPISDIINISRKAE